MANIFSFTLNENFIKGYADYLAQLREQNSGKGYKVKIRVNFIPDGIGNEVANGPSVTVEEEENGETQDNGAELDSDETSGVDAPRSLQH